MHEANIEVLSRFPIVINTHCCWPLKPYFFELESDLHIALTTLGIPVLHRQATADTYLNFSRIDHLHHNTPELFVEFSLRHHTRTIREWRRQIHPNISELAAAVSAAVSAELLKLPVVPDTTYSTLEPYARLPEMEKTLRFLAASITEKSLN